MSSVSPKKSSIKLEEDWGILEILTIMTLSPK
jgi:hypothetical protein